MERHVFWTLETDLGLEHLHLHTQGDEVLADGLVIGIEEQQPFRLHYRLRCAANYLTRSVQIHLHDTAEHTATLSSDGAGRWTDEAGNVQTALQGCIDIDIMATPLTNTLPIQRLALQPGQAAEILVVYFAVPGLQISAERQRYTCLTRGAGESRYRFASLGSAFTANVRVDRDGLVTEYPGLFRRVWAG